MILVWRSQFSLAVALQSSLTTMSYPRQQLTILKSVTAMVSLYVEKKLMVTWCNTLCIRENCAPPQEVSDTVTADIANNSWLYRLSRYREGREATNEFGCRISASQTFTLIMTTPKGSIFDRLTPWKVFSFGVESYCHMSATPRHLAFVS